MLFDHPIYPITNTSVSGLTHSEAVQLLVSTGIDIVQIREKDLHSRGFYEEAEKALEIAREAGMRVLINDRVDIALALGADGVHLGQHDLLPADARKVLGNKAIIGYSTHTIEQAVEAAGFRVDYIAFGPIFKTATKRHPDKVTGLEILRNVRNLTGDIPLVAIGGIDVTNVRSVSEAGADAAAVISGIFGRDSSVVSCVAELSNEWCNKSV
ncbi:MAG: thiamine phosphate synthase [Acidobacteriota bacterium]|nr:thiamine phosphate synthase [Acidobacteriota bacterium]